MLSRRFRNNKDDLVSALRQFDFLQCVVSTIQTGDIHNCYPNFGAYFNERTEPVVVSLAKRGPARLIAPNVDDVTLPTVIRDLDRLAGGLFFSFAGWDRNDWQSETVRSYLRENVGQAR